MVAPRLKGETREWERRRRRPTVTLALVRVQPSTGRVRPYAEGRLGSTSIERGSYNVAVGFRRLGGPVNASRRQVMSGSGSTTSRPIVVPSGRTVRGGKAGPSDPCDITEDTTLNSPDRTVLVTLRDGDPLVIELQEGRLRAKRGDRIAGSVTSARHAQILHCMQQGREYMAVVLSIDRGACRVRIQPK